MQVHKRLRDSVMDDDETLLFFFQAEDGIRDIGDWSSDVCSSDLIDRQWIDYLTGMEDLRQEIGMQAIAQKDPLTEYQRNAYGMFDQLKTNIQRDIVYQIIPVSFQYEQYMRQVVAEQQQRLQVAQHAGETEEQAKAAKTVRKTGAKIGRNDLCPCGSGKKFKHCHEGREGELFALLQGRGATAAPQPASVSAQL